MPGATRGIGLDAGYNDMNVLSVGAGADLLTTFGDITVGESTFGEAHLTFGGFSDLATDITEIHIIGGDDIATAELVGAAPRAVMIGSGKNELVEV